MKLLTQCILFILLIPFSLFCHAEKDNLENPYSVNVMFAFTDINIHSQNKAPDFELTRHDQLSLGYDINRWVGIEAGISRHGDSSSKTQTDLAGTYKTTLSNRSIFIGIRGSYPFDNQKHVYLHAGGLSYRLTIGIEESFDDIKEAGKDSESDKGNGYYYGLGYTWQPTQRTSIRVEYQKQKLLDVFADSSRPFDVEYSSIALGAGIFF